MDIKDAINEYGLISVLKSLFPELKGIDLNNIDFNINNFSVQNFLNEKNKIDNWHFVVGTFPMLCKKTSTKSIDNVINKLLISNGIDLNSSYSDSTHKGITFWDGNGFKIEKVFVDNQNLVMITSISSISKKSIIYNESKLAKKLKSPNWILGFDCVYDSNSISKSNKNLSKFILSPLLFKDDDGDDYIIISLNASEYSEPLIDKIIDDNGGKDAFEKTQHENWDYLHKGHIFTVGYLKDQRCVRINRLPTTAKAVTEENIQSGIHPLSNLINNTVNGLNKQIFNPGDGAVSDGRFVAQSDNASNVVAFDNNSYKLISKLKDVVVKYNPEDDFLRISNETISLWMDRNPEETISFEMPENFQLLLSKGNTLYRMNLFPPGGLTGDWNNSNPKINLKTPPKVLFSKEIVTKPITKIKSVIKQKPVEIKKDEKTLKSEFIKDSVIIGDEDEAIEKTKDKKNNPNYLYWLYIIIGLILLLILFRYCTIDRDASYYYDKGRDYYSSGKYEKAEKSFEEAMDMDNAYVDPLVKRAEMYIDIEEYNKAKYDLDEAIIRENNNWYAYYLRGIANMKAATSKYSRLNNDAINDFSNSIQLNSSSENGKSYYYRAKVYQIIDDNKFCEDFYQACEFNTLDACEIIDKSCYPNTGYMPYNKNFGPGIFTGINSFEFDNSLGEKDIVFNLTNINTKRKVRAQFIRKGEKLIVDKIPNGTYKIELFQGNNWTNSLLMNDNITKGGFLDNSEFVEIEKFYVITTNSLISGIQFNVSGGDVGFNVIDEDEFFN